MSEWHYRRFSIELARRGRENELSPLPRETSAILRKVFDATADGLTVQEAADGLRVPASEIRALCFSLHALDGDRSGPPVGRGVLRLVK